MCLHEPWQATEVLLTVYTEWDRAQSWPVAWGPIQYLWWICSSWYKDSVTLIMLLIYLMFSF